MNQLYKSNNYLLLKEFLTNFPDFILYKYVKETDEKVINEIKEYLISTNSVMLVMIDLCYEKVADVIKETDVYKTIVVSAGNSMSIFMKLGYIVTKSRKIKKPRFKGEYIYWNDFFNILSKIFSKSIT